jgi:tetratricopeptide (TPR) repeat protein
MSPRLLTLAAAIAFAAAAQPAPPAPGPDPHGGLINPSPRDEDKPHEGLLLPPDELPKLKREREKDIEFLFGALKAAPDKASAKAVEERIWAVWASAGNDSTNLLMSRAKKATDEKDYDLALRLLSAVIEIRPEFTEAWNRRATVYYMQKDYANSIADIGKVLTREPRHFGALSGLGLIMQDIGDEKRALDAYRKALEVYPRQEGMAEKVKSLTEKVDGREL